MIFEKTLCKVVDFISCDWYPGGFPEQSMSIPVFLGYEKKEAPVWEPSLSLFGRPCIATPYLPGATVSNPLR